MFRSRSVLSSGALNLPSRTPSALPHMRRTCITSLVLNSRPFTPPISSKARSFGSAAAVVAQPTLAGSIVPPARKVNLSALPIVNTDESKVSVGWDSKTWSKFHNIWLRDHCRCPKCFHPITKQRLLNTFDIPPDIKPVNVESKPDGLEVTWHFSEPHVSLFPWTWLQRNSYDPPTDSDKASFRKIEWDAKIQQSPPGVMYDEAMAGDDRGLFKWLTNIDRFGFSFIYGVPPTAEATEKLVERIGFIRETQYGGFWDFTSDLAKGDTAYTSIALGAHTDNTYYTDPSGLQLFHLLSHTNGSGGKTLLVDGFAVAATLKQLHPEAYTTLSQVPVPAHAAGEPSSIYRPSTPSGYPVLRHDPCTGELIQVRWNNDDRSVMNHLSPNMVEKWYDAIRTWHKYLTSPDYEYWVQLRPGTAVLTDNHRVLHGRSAFDGKRRMCGAYIGVDEYRSKLAVLRERFASDSVPPATNHSSETSVNGRSIWSAAF